MISLGLLIGLLIIIAAILIAALSKPLNLHKNFYIKLFFVLFLLSSISEILSYLTSLSIFSIAGSMSFFFTVAFVLLHSSEVLGNRKTAIFFIIAFLFGLISELLSVIYGLYYYTIPSFFFGMVPLATPISWVFIIYVSYILADLFLFGFGGEKPKKTDNLWFLLGLLILTSSISGLIAVNLDMILDPISIPPNVAQWVYSTVGPYFGVPISNFVGWFLVTTLVVFIFRCYEVLSSSKDFKIELNTYSYLYIIVVYLIYFLFNAVKAFNLGRIEYILIGTTTMMPFILIGLLALILYKKREDMIR
ncbi:MAG: carotenoid biosynthesis protein [Methanobacteriaceae archaeon]|nr:carotenoid biosynthesis protein [Methanobacteriaceae archaeon]